MESGGETSFCLSLWATLVKCCMVMMLIGDDCQSVEILRKTPIIPPGRSPAEFVAAVLRAAPEYLRLAAQANARRNGEVCQHRLDSFLPTPHRLEFVGTQRQAEQLRDAAGVSNHIQTIYQAAIKNEGTVLDPSQVNGNGSQAVIDKIVNRKRKSPWGRSDIIGSIEPSVCDGKHEGKDWCYNHVVNPHSIARFSSSLQCFNAKLIIDLELDRLDQIVAHHFSRAPGDGGTASIEPTDANEAQEWERIVQFTTGNS